MSTADSPSPACSVVVASNRDFALLHACVESLSRQCAAAGVELIVARAGELSGEAIGWLNERKIMLVTAPHDATIPELRGLGMAKATGALVAVTEDHCIAHADWLDSLRRAAGTAGDRSGADVTGGGMDNARRSRAVDWAAYFAEYGFFSSLRRESGPASTSPLLTGANVAYARSVSATVAAWAAAGEWENVVHQRLAKAGHVLRFAPEAVILQNKSYSFGAFCVDRYEHGFDYARTRLAIEGARRWWVLLAMTPLLPFVLLVRVARASASGRWTRFVAAMPVTLAFLGAWSVGEAAGYLAGPSGLVVSSNTPPTTER